MNMLEAQNTLVSILNPTVLTSNLTYATRLCQSSNNIFCQLAIFLDLYGTS